MGEDIQIDARGLLCPLPVLKLRKRLQGVEAGTVVQLMTTDPAAIIDLPHYCFESGHELIDSSTENDVTTYRVRKV